PIATKSNVRTAESYFAALDAAKSRSFCRSSSYSRRFTSCVACIATLLPRSLQHFARRSPCRASPLSTTAPGLSSSSTGPTYVRTSATPRSSRSPSRNTTTPSPPSTTSSSTARRVWASPPTGSIRPAMIGLLFPRFDHPAIEERYASWQCQMLLRRDVEVEFCRYDPEEPASFAAGDLESDHVLVITDPLLVPPPKLALRLREALVQSPGTAAALPVSNE